jgi:hypothetical protein
MMWGINVVVGVWRTCRKGCDVYKDSVASTLRALRCEIL